MTQETPHLIQNIERGLELPDGFLIRLLNERDDWSFIIKTHALVESAVNHALIAKLRKREVSKVIARLDLSNESTGKLALVKSLGLAQQEIARLKLQAELRVALECGDFRLHYQPIIDLAKGQLVGFEALLRWQRDAELIFPDEFLSAPARNSSPRSRT